MQINSDDKVCKRLKQFVVTNCKSRAARLNSKRNCIKLNFDENRYIKIIEFYAKSKNIQDSLSLIIPIKT